MASALCVQHSRIEIYGGLADKIVCPAALTAATATGLLRIVADRHWASDVIAGAMLGSLVGATVSWLHLRGDGAAPASLSVRPADRALVYRGSF
jgi:membrane-associated phospholipid phosphatase